MGRGGGPVERQKSTDFAVRNAITGEVLVYVFPSKTKTFLTNLGQ